MTKDQLVAEIYRFLGTRPGFEPGNYSTYASYRADVRSATNQRHDAETMLAVIERSWTITVGDMFVAAPSRLTLNADGTLDYCARQYYCVEYRGAVARWLSSVLWAYYRDHCHADTREKIVKAARLAFRSRRIREYFS